MLFRNPTTERQREKQRRYRLRRVYGQSVHRVTTNDGPVKAMLIAKGYLPEDAIYDRPMIERALTKFIDDAARKTNRYW